MSREIWCRWDDVRDASANDATIALPSWRAVPPPAAPAEGPASGFEELFRRHYPALRGLLAKRQGPGLAILLTSGEQLQASAWMGARRDDIHAVVVGRHTHCDLFLPSDTRLSLRHLAVVLHRQRDDAPVRFRVCDLRTPTAFGDEKGQPLRALEAEGPLLLRCASFEALLFPRQAGEPLLPEDPAEAWEHVPERVYVEAEGPDPERRPLRPVLDAGVLDPRQTLALTFPGPRHVSPAQPASGPAVGELLIEARGQRVSLAVGARQLRQGLLVGRYDRCDGGGLPMLGSELSRVHALVTEFEGELHAIDTGSTNGCWSGSQLVRSARLWPSGTPVVLAGWTEISWRPYH